MKNTSIAGITLNAPNLIFLALIFLQFLPRRRPDEAAPALQALVVALEIFFLAYASLKKDRGRMRTPGDLLAILYGIIFVWDLLTVRLDVLDKMLFPTPASIVPLIVQEIPAFFEGLVSSLGLLFAGYGTAVVLGITLGLLAGWNTRLGKIATPISRLLGPIPPTVYIPYAIALLPTFKISSMFVIFVGAFWPIFINTFNGVFGIEGRIIDSARVLNLGQRTMFLKVILPGTLPSIMSGATIGLAMSFILLTAAEIIGASSGLGWYVKYFSEVADYPRVIAGIIFAGTTAAAIMFAFGRVEKRLLRWRG